MRFAPKESIQLDPPQSHQFTRSELAQYNGINKPQLFVAIKGVVYDVTRNKAKYSNGENYSVFIGKDASLLLAMSSLDNSADREYVQKSKAERDYILSTLSDTHKKTLEEWVSYFSQRYNIMGTLVD